MVKTRRSNGETGEVDDGSYAPNDVGGVSDEKASNWSQRELRSNQYKVARKIQHWPTKYSRRRRSIKMNRIVFPESDTEPEKYSRRSRQVRVFFADEPESTNRSVRIRRNRGPRKNYEEDSEDKPIQQNVRRSGRQRKLLHHNFNESWITNELKVRGYPGLYGIPGSSSSDEFTSGEEARDDRKRMQTHNEPPANTDEDTQLSRLRRTSARFSNSNKKLNVPSGSDSENDNNETVIEKKPTVQETEAMDQYDDDSKHNDKNGDVAKTDKEEKPEQATESKQAPARSTRGLRSRGKPKKEDFIQNESASESESSESGSEIIRAGPPRRSKRQRKQPAFVQIAPRQTRTRPNTFTIRKKPYSLRERKPKILRRKAIRSQSPSTSSSSSSSDSDSDQDLNVSMKNKSKGRQKSKSTDEKKTDRALRDIQPVEVDSSVRFTSVGGLEDHIKCLREMVLFPLMYPDLFRKFKTRPAKGVLFHGPPGTGKTLLARALASECALIGGRKVSFFMRKGADCLKKWVGESERHLKLLFQQANKMKPSIIFFDEIDALAPVRSVRQEQVHTSVVGTLLAEMDGLCDRGEVVVIGATNRLDAVDPALRRAGRFDRELYFPTPHSGARRDILHIYTKDWHPPPSENSLDTLANATIGYGGSDLKALCSESVLKALRRVYPQVYESEHALIIDTNNVEVKLEDMLEAKRTLVAAGSRASMQISRPLAASARPLLNEQLHCASLLLNRNIALNSRDSPLSTSSLLISGECADTHLAPALLADLERYSVVELSVATVHSALTFTPEQALISTFSECRRGGRGGRGGVLVVRAAEALWEALGRAGAALFLQLWRARAAGVSTLLLATTHLPHHLLPQELQDLFPLYKDCVYTVREPNATEVVNFLKPIIAELPLVAPVVESKEPPPPLPRAPPPPPPRESPEEIARRKRKEDYKLRELRIFLRDICRKLASNRRFYKFTKPVDLEEVTDYLDIVKQPMDLETMMTKVDMHKYICAKEFLDDIDLICANALEYNPDRTSSDKQIRHEACSLRDHAHALIDVEMDSDFELECQDIARKRRAEGTGNDADLPDFIYTASNLQSFKAALDGAKEEELPHCDKGDTNSAKRKRKRISTWSRGFVTKRQRTAKSFSNKDISAITDDDSKENKPITSTPLPNGDCDSRHTAAASSSAEASDEDAPLRRRREDVMFDLSATTHATALLGSPTKSTEKSPSKNSPKKRHSGHETASAAAEPEKVLINKTELENILYKNTKALRSIGLNALLDLHSQLSNILHSYSDKYDRSKLPQEYQSVISRYVHQLARK